ncbi:MAG: hypothetical protein M1840_001938 [Geoglossum simile]|nr:MAG: hypothetical protein M1840_001938 [Geoglossum simile]
MVESSEDGFSAIVVKEELIAGLLLESSVTVKYIVDLATSLATAWAVAALPTSKETATLTDTESYAWITIFVAILAAFEKWPQEKPDFTRFNDVLKRVGPRFDKILKWIWCAGKYVQNKKSCRRAGKLLEPLADIQAVTRIAILISACAQGCAITFYHQELVLNYWALTIISFWAARPAFIIVGNQSGVDLGGRRPPSM